MVPLVHMAPALQRPVWIAANLVMLTASLYLLRRWLTKLWPDSATQPRSEMGFWLVTILTSVTFLTSPIQGLTHDLAILLLVMLTVDALCAERPGWAGVWAGLGAACKATPLLFAVVFLWQRRFRACATMALTLSVAMLLPDVLYPQQSGEIWAQSWVDTFLTPLKPGMPAEARGAWVSWNGLNQSLAGTMHRLTTAVPPQDSRGWNYWDASIIQLDSSQRGRVILGTQLAVLALLLTATWRPRRQAADDWLRTLGQGSAVACAMVLLSPMSSKPHFCTLVIPLSAAWMCHLHRRRDWLLIALTTTASAMGWLDCHDLGLTFIADPLGGYGGHTIAAVCAFAGSIYLALRWRRFVAREQQPEPLVQMQRWAA